MFKNKKRIFLFIAIILVLIVSYYMYSIIQFGKGIQDDQQQQPPVTNGENNPIVDPKDEPPEWTGKDRVNILLLGIDARDADAQGRARSDTIMVLSIDPATNNAALFSIMRDTYAAIPGYAKQRINAANAYGGPDLAMTAVGDLLDLPIHFYVSIDFEGFIALVDAIGGIEFEVEKNMRYYDPTDDPAYGTINLEKGLQVLDGDKALQYVRFRHDTYADYTRTERQRNIMKAVAKEMLTVSNLIRLPQTLQKIEPYIKTNLTLQQMWALGNLGYKIKADDIVTEQLPPRHLLRDEVINDAKVITTDLDKLQAYVQDVFEQQNVEETEESEGTEETEVEG